MAHDGVLTGGYCALHPSAFAMEMIIYETFTVVLPYEGNLEVTDIGTGADGQC